MILDENKTYGLLIKNDEKELLRQICVQYQIKIVNPHLFKNTQCYNYWTINKNGVQVANVYDLIRFLDDGRFIDGLSTLRKRLLKTAINSKGIHITNKSSYKTYQRIVDELRKLHFHCDKTKSFYGCSKQFFLDKNKRELLPYEKGDGGFAFKMNDFLNELFVLNS